MRKIGPGTEKCIPECFCLAQKAPKKKEKFFPSGIFFFHFFFRGQNFAHFLSCIWFFTGGDCGEEKEIRDTVFILSASTTTMAVFTGTLKLRVVEATDLKPTDFAMRLGMGSRRTTIDPYVSVGIDSDPPHCLRTKSQSKTCQPVWNEDFSVEIQNGTALSLAVFDDRAIPPDEFVADCSLSFEEYAQQQQTTGWVRNGGEFH